MPRPCYREVSESLNSSDVRSSISEPVIYFVLTHAEECRVCHVWEMLVDSVCNNVWERCMCPKVLTPKQSEWNYFLSFLLSFLYLWNFQETLNSKRLFKKDSHLLKNKWCIRCYHQWVPPSSVTGEGGRVLSKETLICFSPPQISHQRACHPHIQYHSQSTH